MIQGSRGTIILDWWQGRKRKRYRIDIIPIYSYQTGTLSSETDFCNEYGRKKET
jgi:hypothetical protein